MSHPALARVGVSAEAPFTRDIDKRNDMATIKVKDVPEEAPERATQRKPQSGRYALQVDRQTKRSYETPEEAEAAGSALKKAFPVVHIAVYDTVDYTRKAIEAE